MATLFKRGGVGNWVIQWFDSDGKRQSKSSRTTDHAAATRIAAKLEAETALRRDGVIDGRLDKIAKQAARTIDALLTDFGAAMRSRAGIDHIEDTRRFIDAICKANAWKLLRDIEPDGVNQFAQQMFDDGKSSRTVQSYLTGIKSFTIWAVKNGKLASDPLATVSKPAPEADRRLTRRYLSHEEFQWLNSITRQTGESYGMTGTERALLYQTAIQTGLRAGELRSLTRGKLHLAGDSPFIIAAAKSTKNSKQARQYITPDLGAELSAMVGRKVAGSPVFRMPDEFDVASMLRADLTLARAAWLDTFQDSQKRIEADAGDFLRATDSEGDVIDFHALRHTCATWLIQTGADIKTVQAVMRHSNIRLTMDRYGHLFPGAEADAVSRLAVVFGQFKTTQATGTDGALHLRQQSDCDTVRNLTITDRETEGDLTESSSTETQKNPGKLAISQGKNRRFKSAPRAQPSS